MQDLFSGDTDSHLEGGKAAGLRQLPEAWVPPFIVLPVPVGEWSPDAAISDGEEETVRTWTESVRNEGAQGIIVRSSAPGEGLAERGLYESHKCEAYPDVVVTLVESMRRETRGRIGLVLQVDVGDLGVGHLSNERRVTRRGDDWACEATFRKRSDSLPPKIRAKASAAAPLDEAPIRCSNLEELEDALREVASYALDRFDQRCHIEWVWDGETLWLVQLDKEDEVESPPPSAGWVTDPSVGPLAAAQLPLLKRAEKAEGPWSKTRCVRELAACGLPFPSVFVLEDCTTLESLADGIVTKALRADLTALSSAPLVVRTDVDPEGGGEMVMLPRTDVIVSVEEAETFLVSAAQALGRKGLNPGQYCFLFHTFIASRSAAFAFSVPGNPRVRIDSTWGLADGLLYYAHDSFEVDTGAFGLLSKKVRCKDKYLDVAADGDWHVKEAGRPWDWKPSLSEEELLEIAGMSTQLADCLGKPVSTMFFVDNKPQATYPLCLPWYFNTDDIPSGISIDDTAVPVYNQPKTISNRADLAELVDLASSGTLPPRSSVRLKPDPEHVRDPDFAAEVAGVVTEHEIAVELEGSTLHHAYYVLDRAGARVRCVDPFEPDPVELQYGKLVRDKIPAQIEARGERVIASRVTGSGLMEALKEKAIEEAHEVFTESESVDLIEEVADLYEVMRSLVNVMGRDFDEVVSIADKKRDEAGGFAEGWILEGTEQLPLLRRTRRESDRAADSLVSAERPRSSDLSKVRPSTGHVSRPRLIKEGRRIVARLLPSRSNPERQYLAVYPGDKFVEVTVDAGSLSVAVKKVASVDTAALVRRAQLDLFADGE